MSGSYRPAPAKPAVSFRDMPEEDMLLAIQQLRADLLDKLDRDLRYMKRRARRNERRTAVDVDLERDTKLFQRIATFMLEILEENQDRPTEIIAIDTKAARIEPYYRIEARNMNKAARGGHEL